MTTPLRHRIIQLADMARYNALEDWCSEGSLAAIRKAILRFFTLPVPLLSAATLADLLHAHFSTNSTVPLPWPCSAPQHVLGSQNIDLQVLEPQGVGPIDAQGMGPKVEGLTVDELKVIGLGLESINDSHWNTSSTASDFFQTAPPRAVGELLNGQQHSASSSTLASPSAKNLAPSSAAPPSAENVADTSSCADLSAIQVKLASDVPPSQTFLALIRLMPFLRSMFLELENTDHTLATKFKGFSDKYCRLADLESTIPGLDSHLPFSCTLQDVVMSGIACVSFPNSTKNCDRFPHNSIEDFPNEVCHAPLSVLQRRAGANPRLRAFNWFDDVHLPLELEDLRPVPANVPAETRRSEVLTYLALYRSLRLIYSLVEDHHSACHHLYSNRTIQLIPGHRLEAVGWLKWKTDESPFLFFSKDMHNKHVLSIGMRGTTNKHEWAVDLHYAKAFIKIPTSPEIQRALQELPSTADTNFPIYGPAGFVDIVNEILPFVLETVDLWLDSLPPASPVGSGRPATNKSPVIVIYGHSLGGSVGNLLAFALAKEFSDRARVSKSNAKIPRIDGVFFGPPVVLSEPLLNTYATLANVRNLIDLGDPLFYLPCHSINSRYGHLRCPAGHIVSPLNSLNSSDPLTVRDQSFTDTSAKDQYLKSPGLVPFDVHGQPKSSVLNVLPPLRRMKPLRRSRNLQEGGAADLLSLMPTQITREDIMSTHLGSFGCILAAEACRGVPWAKFQWGCPVAFEEDSEVLI